MGILEFAMRVLAFVPMDMASDGSSIGLRLSANGLEPASHYAYNMAECSNAERDSITASMTTLGAFWYVLNNGVLFSNSNEVQNGLPYSFADALLDAGMQAITEERAWLPAFLRFGYGERAIGGYTGSLVTITNLNNSGVGSLRWACETLNYPRHIVASVSGWIDLATDILINDSYVSLDLPTIGIRGAGLSIKFANQVIVRNLRAYRGHDLPINGSNSGDCISVDLSSNVVIDHCIARFSVDECLSVSRSSYVTVQNCQIEEGIANAVSNPHDEPDHGFGTLVYLADRVSIVRNFYGLQQQRCPQIGSSTRVEVIDNVLFNNYLGMLNFPDADVTELPEVDFIGNVIKQGFLSVDNGQSIRSSGDNTSAILPHAFAEDNRTKYHDGSNAKIRQVYGGYQTPIAGEATRVAVTDNSGLYQRDTPFNGITSSLGVASVEAHVIANVGIEAAYRIADDGRVLDTIAHGLSSIAGETNAFVDEVILGSPSADNQRTWPAL